MNKKTLIVSSLIVIISILLFLFIINFETDTDLYIGENVDTSLKTQPEDNIENFEKFFDKAPEFSLNDFNGNNVSLSDSTGKVRVVNSWATWCPFCVDELSDFAKLQEFFGDEVVVITINRSESLNKAKNFTDTLSVTDTMIMLIDPKDSFYKSIGGFSMPETLFIDGDGNIRVHKRGPMKFDEMKEIVELIINSQ